MSSHMADLIIVIIILDVLFCVLVWGKNRDLQKSLKPGGKKNELLLTVGEEVLLIGLAVVLFFSVVVLMFLWMAEDGEPYGKTLLISFLISIAAAIFSHHACFTGIFFLVIYQNNKRKKAIKAAQLEKEAAKEQTGKNPGL